MVYSSARILLLPLPLTTVCLIHGAWRTLAVVFVHFLQLINLSSLSLLHDLDPTHDV